MKTVCANRPKTRSKLFTITAISKNSQEKMIDGADFQIIN